MHPIIGSALASVEIVDRVGPVLGVIAFAGLAVLAFLIFQQAREVRRLREWAGRAPERASEAIEAQLATAEAREEVTAGPRPGWWDRQRQRLEEARKELARRYSPAWREVDRRSPIDPRIIAAAVIGLIVAAVVTDGFGLVSTGSGGRGAADAAAPPSALRVAVLNGTQEPGVPAVPGLASRVAHQVVKPAGYRAGPVTNAPSSFATTVIMFIGGHGPDARALSTAVKPKLGRTPVQPMTGTARSAAGKADLALVIGRDESTFGQ